MKKIAAVIFIMVLCLSGCMQRHSNVVNTLPAVSVGETSEGDLLRITLDKAYCNQEIPSYSGTHYTADNGKIYLVLIFDAENISDKALTINPFGFTAYADDYTVGRSTLMDVYGESSFDGNVDAGRKRKRLCRV